jgi:hypothetical protein
MTGDRRGFVREASLRLDQGIDPAAVGAAVTVELCGHWEHEGGCRWPHNNEIWPDGKSATFRMLFVAPEAEADAVHARIDKALRASDDWIVLAANPRPLREDERLLAVRLARTPPPS